MTTFSSEAFTQQLILVAALTICLLSTGMSQNNFMHTTVYIGPNCTTAALNLNAWENKMNSTACGALCPSIYHSGACLPGSNANVGVGNAFKCNCTDAPADLPASTTEIAITDREYSDQACATATNSPAQKVIPLVEGMCSPFTKDGQNFKGWCTANSTRLDVYMDAACATQQAKVIVNTPARGCIPTATNSSMWQCAARPASAAAGAYIQVTYYADAACATEVSAGQSFMMMIGATCPATCPWAMEGACIADTDANDVATGVYMKCACVGVPVAAEADTGLDMTMTLADHSDLACGAEVDSNDLGVETGACEVVPGGDMSIMAWCPTTGVRVDYYLDPNPCSAGLPDMITMMGTSGCLADSDTSTSTLFTCAATEAGEASSSRLFLTFAAIALFVCAILI